MKKFLLFSMLMMFFGAGLCFGTWVKQTSGTTMDLYDVWFKRPPGDRGWAVGAAGTIVSTQNMGTNWVGQSSQTTLTLYGIAWDLTYLLSKEWATAVGGDTGGGVTVHTTNSGNTWTVSTVPFNDPLAISYGDSLKGWAVGASGSVWGTTDGGLTWAYLMSTLRVHWLGAWFVNDRLGWKCGTNGAIMKTTNSGASWQSQASGVSDILRGICFHDSVLGCAVGNNGIIVRTTDGGTSWNRITTGYNEDLHGVFLSYYGYVGYAVGANGRILATSDGGAIWVAEPSGVTHTLRGVWCWLDLPGIWAFAAGDSGTILHQFNPIGVEEEKAEVRNEKLEIRIKPNPFVSFTRVLGHEKENFAVYDIAGKMVGTYRGDRIGIDLKSGVYFICGLSGKIKSFKPVRIVKIK